jgi:MFS family permease
VLIVSMIILSFSEIFAMPFMSSVLVSKTDESNRGMYTGLYSVAWSAAFIIAPLTGAFVISNYGFAELWWCMGILALLSVFGFYYVVPKIYKRPDPV